MRGNVGGEERKAPEGGDLYLADCFFLQLDAAEGLVAVELGGVECVDQNATACQISRPTSTFVARDEEIRTPDSSSW